MIILRSAALGAALAMASAIVPLFAQQNGPMAQSPGVRTQPGAMSDDMVHKVATALRHVALIRQQYSQRAQASTATPQQRQDLSNQAEQEMVRAIGDEGLSLEQYEQAIQMAQADPVLRQRLLSVARSSSD